MTEIRFGEIAAGARLRLPDLVRRWLPDGRARGREYVALNPTRGDRRLGSFKINLATGAKGGDAIALLAYLDGSDQARAARRLAEEIGVVPHTDERKRPRIAAHPRNDNARRRSALVALMRDVRA